MERHVARLQIDNRGVRIVPVYKFEGYYVSEDGIVYTNKKGRLTPLKVSYVESSSGLTFKFLKLYRNSVRYSRTVHRVVYESFNKTLLDRKDHIQFKDHNPFNCHINNLTLEKPSHPLMEGEQWIEGYEGRYFLKGADVWSVINKDYPKKLKPMKDFHPRKYTLYGEDGIKTHYVRE